MIVVGHLQKVPMLFYFAEWSRVVLHGRKPIRLTELGELMLKGQPPNLKYLVVAKKLVIKMHLPLVSTTKGDHETGGRTVRTFALHVMHKARTLPTPLKIVVNQKMTRALQKCSVKSNRQW